MQRILGLDGIRGFAVLVVMFSHGHGLFGITSGTIGVDIFFALSGFLITGILAREFQKQATIGLKSFYIRRVLRLAPALYASLILFILLGLVLGVFFPSIYRGDVILESAAFAGTYTMNWGRAFNVTGFLFGHTWSLGIEEQFYLIWPLILLVSMKLDRSLRLALCVALALAIAVVVYRTSMVGVYPAPRIVNGFDTRSDGLMTGATLALALLVFKDMFPPALLARAGACAGILGAGLILFVIVKSMQIWPFTQIVVVNIAAALVIMGVVVGTKTFVSAALDNEFLRFTGRISYGLYLYHFPIFVLFDQMIGSKTLPVQNVQALDLFILFPIVYLVSWLSFTFIEQPFLKLKDRMHGETVSRASVRVHAP